MEKRRLKFGKDETLPRPNKYFPPPPINGTYYEYIDVNGNTVTAAQLPNPFNTKTQTVKATVTNKLNGACVISENIQFTVDPLPVVNAVITIEQCDNDEDNDGKTKFNLTSYENLISENSENETFEY